MTSPSTARSLLSLRHEAPHTLDAAHKKHALPVVLPDKDADLVGVFSRRLVLGLGLEVLEQEAWRRGHAVALKLPQVDLVNDRCGQDGRRSGGRRRRGVRVQRARGCRVGVLGAAHLRVRVRGEVGDDLVGGDAGVDGAFDGLLGDFGGHEVGVAGTEVREEGEEGDLERRGRVGVEAEVGLEDDEARDRGAAGGGGGRDGAGVGGCEGGAEGRGGVREGRDGVGC